MGGRGTYALRRRLRNFTAPTSSAVRARATAGGGVDEDYIKATFGSNYTLAEVKSILGGGASNVTLTRTTDGVGAIISGNGYTASFRLTKSGNDVTFHGDSLFARGSNNAQGDAIRKLGNGLTPAIKSGKVHIVRVGNAIGSAGSTSAQGSDFWARMGVSAPLSRVFGSNYKDLLPANLKGAKEVADLFLMKGGREWWSGNKVKNAAGEYVRVGGNRRGFQGEVNFRNKTSSGYKVAKRYLGLK